MDFELINLFRTIGTQLPPISCVDHVELRVLAKDMENLEMPSGYQWNSIEKISEIKYRLHQ